MAEILAANQITIAKVLDGEQGIPGEPGADGKTSYFHIKYSAVANPTSSSEMSETPLAYIGTYVDFTEADSTDPTKYTWSRFEGIQGEKGEQGIPGIGQDGRTSYLHIAYATSADGSEGFSISESANKTYIGQYTDFVSTDSTDYTKYSWTKIKGEMSAEQIAQLNQASTDASTAKDSVDTLSDKTRSGFIETLSGSGFVQSTKTENGGTAEVVVYGKSVQDGTPTPEAPVEIQSVESPKVTACGTNVFDAEAFYQHYYAFKQDIYKVTVDGVECLRFRGSSGYGSHGYHHFPLNLKHNTQYLISFRGKKDSVYGHNSTGITVNYLDGIPSDLVCDDTTTFTDVGMISRADKTITSLSITYAYDEYCYLDINSICIREVGTEFEPYTGKTVTLSDIVLRSAGEAKDRLFKDSDGLWKVEKNIGDADLGTLNWIYESGGTRFYSNTIDNLVKANSGDGVMSNCICSKLATGTPSETWNNRNNIVAINNYRYGANKVIARATSFSADAAAFKTAMSGAILYYELATPTYETLPDSIQEELNALTTYNPITNVFVSAGVTPYIDVSFWTRDYYAKNSAENAAKVATNFLGYDSTNGLIIGNKTSGTWSGYRSQILPGSFNVLDASSTVLASFGTTTVIGEEAKANLHLTFNNFSMVDKDDNKFFEVGDLRDASGVATLLFYSKLYTSSNGVVTIDLHVNIDSIVSVVVTNVTISSSEYSIDGSCITITGLEKNVLKTFEITYTTLSSIPYLTFGTRNNSGKIGYFSSIRGDNLIASGFASHAEGSYSKSTADFSHSEGYNTQANGVYSHAEGNGTVADGDASHAEGKETKTFYAYSHAEGQLSYARGQCSHAEGFNTTAYGYMAHSEGNNTEAHGNESHAEGWHTYAGGKCSHAEGYYTIAGSDYQHVSGKYNNEDYNDLYAFIIGNGTSEGEESNAFAVDWTGNVYMGLRDCNITDSGTALSVTSGASTLDGLLAQAIINTFSYANAKEILYKPKPGDVNMNVKKLLQKIVEKVR